ncbi:tyrosine--tRNA ligase [Planctomicrobium piriforme]|uniref:Tyrosine--tRNA ligase n=1 Tax=Planctomicrobium piriforme TaxID=1576369 RepID=A0A1I3I8B8_9PLAN|nr:tyrosine--tRNA ligase [Planctomicrobium piriforme]SFI44139.1 tyrosyl-tRNA synthetase [Planctomicrobium piriforme]
MSFPPVESQLETLMRGVEKVVPAAELTEKLTKSRQTNTPLRIKYGIDPTAASVHLGHTVPLRKMRQFQELGHQAVIIIGNATAMVGDPSGRDEARKKQLTEAEVEANARFYLDQVGKVVDLSKAEIHRNGDWFGKMGLVDILQLCGKVTIAQLLTRDDFAKRMAAEAPIFLHECLYPVMQAWDSVMIRSDIELGGTEQLYSFMLARDLQRGENLPQQIGMMSPILVGTDGVRRMGKSLGNYIGISEDPYEMIKKFMQLPDAVMRMFYELLTDLPLGEVDALLAGHPKEAKVRLGKIIITEYHNADAAEAASRRWQQEIGEGSLPSEIPEVTVARALLNADGCLQAAQLLKEIGLVPSTSVAMQRIKGGAVYILNGEEKTQIADRAEWVPLRDGMIVRAGKKDWRRVRIGH